MLVKSCVKAKSAGGSCPLAEPFVYFLLCFQFVISCKWLVLSNIRVVLVSFADRDWTPKAVYGVVYGPVVVYKI